MATEKVTLYDPENNWVLEVSKELPTTSSSEHDLESDDTFLGRMI